MPYVAPVTDVIDSVNFIRLVTGQTVPDPDAIELVTAFGRLATEVIAPTDAIGDVLGCRLEPGGAVWVPDELARAHSAYVEGGWSEAIEPVEIGGGGLSSLLRSALMELYTSANLALSLHPMLTQGAIGLLAEWGSPAQRERYLGPLVRGEWSGTMLLTEPDAGSDVGALRMRAEPADDGRWRLRGTKIFITWGEHELSHNIVHLVLARTPGAPPGSKGISLFVVPKVLPDGSRNRIFCSALEHKLGIHASPTCVMELDGAIGELIGQELDGMRAMFTMMNASRLAIGLQGLAVAERSWQQSLGYASERRQGRAVATPPGAQARLVEHPDVRRMLADLRSTARACRLLLYLTAGWSDVAAQGDAAAASQADLLTPMAKAWPTDAGVAMASLAIQIHGGAGYVEETGVAQRLRDARIGPIYEGTNGIQAIDLVLRKVVADGGEALARHLDLLESLLPGHDAPPALVDGLRAVRVATRWVLSGACTDEERLLGATAFLRLVATTTAGVLLFGAARRAEAAGVPTARELDEDAMSFAVHHVGPACGLLGSITGGAAATPRFDAHDEFAQ